MVNIYHLIPKEIINFIQILNKKGYKIYLVGGAVRDRLLNIPNDDLDFASNVPLNWFLDKKNQKKYGFKTYSLGAKFGTLLIRIGTLEMEITHFRKESNYKDNRHPDKIEYIDNIKEDLKRRDFTINAIAYDPANDKLIDPFNGVQDLKNKIIRAVGNPDNRFKEDAIRILRAIRFAVKLNFNIEKNTLDSIKKNKDLLKNIAFERIQKEINKLFEYKNITKTFELLEKTELINILFPEIKNIDYKKLKQANTLILRWAVILQNTDENNVKKILKKFRYSNNFIKQVLDIIKYSKFDIKNNDYLIRKYLYFSNFNMSALNLWFINHNFQNFNEIMNKIKKLKNENFIKLAVNGNDIMQELNIKSGIYIKEILNYLHDQVLQNPDLNNKETLLKLAKEYYNT